MKRVMLYKDGCELDEDNGLIPQCITDVICRVKKTDKWASECGSQIKGNWKLTLLLEKTK